MDKDKAKISISCKCTDGYKKFKCPVCGGSLFDITDELVTLPIRKGESTYQSEREVINCRRGCRSWVFGPNCTCPLCDDLPYGWDDSSPQWIFRVDGYALFG
jgi:hypothetical protein